jgi:hypothetical protein
VEARMKLRQEITQTPRGVTVFYEGPMPKPTGSVIDYRDRSNQELQDLCNDIDFDFMDLDETDIDRLQCMECDWDRIQWLEIVRREREEGA